MAHPTRTGDLVVFAYPPYQFDAATPGTLIARSHVLRPARLRARRAGPRPTTQHAGDVPRRRPRHRQGRGHRAARSTSRRRSPTCSASPSRSRARAGCCSTSLKDGDSITPVSIVGLNDFHGQLDPTTLDGRQRHQRPGRRRRAARDDVRRGARRRCPAPGLLLAGGDNVGASPPNSALLEDMPAIDVENAWGLDATSLRQPRVRLRRRPAPQAAPAPGRTSRSSATNIVETATGQAPAWVTAVGRVHGQRRQGRRHRRRAAEHARARRRAGTTAGLTFLDEATADQGRVASGCSRRASTSRSWSSTRARRTGATRSATPPACRGTARSSAIADALQDTTVDAMIAGHTHRISNLMRGDILVTEGINAGTSYSVLQLMVKRRRRRLGRRRDPRRQEPRRRRRGPTCRRSSTTANAADAPCCATR